MSASVELSGADAGTGLMLPSGETMEVAADAAASEGACAQARQLRSMPLTASFVRDIIVTEFI